MEPTLPTFWPAEMHVAFEWDPVGARSVGVSQPTQHLEKIWRNIQIFGDCWRNYLISLALPRGLKPLFSP
jgi:hypothetical protein